MNIVNKLTLRQLKLNKRRTLVTILGVMISVAMVTAVATLFFSFQGLMQKQAIANDGLWHVRYHAVNRDQLAAIKKDEATKDVILNKKLGYAELPEGNNPYKPYLFVEAYNSLGFTSFPIELTQGRFPENSNEVIISSEIADNGGIHYHIGDMLTLQVGERSDQTGKGEILDENSSIQMVNGQRKEALIHTNSITYTIVGMIKRPIFEPAQSPGYTIISFVDAAGMGPEDSLDTNVILKKINGALFTHAADLAKQNNIKVVEFNEPLLRFYGITDNVQLYHTLVSLCVIITLIIMAGSVALIYNAFAISVSERSRYLGMLSSVGATKRQKRNSVYYEGAVIGLISIPLGLLCGLVGMVVTFWGVNSSIQGAFGINQDFRVVVTPMSIMIAITVSLFTIFVSTYIPARRASKISAMDAIRQTMDIKLSGKDVKTSKFVRHVLGIEAEFGLKNLKRNKRRYQAVVLSLVISIVLFLSVSFFTANLEKTFKLSQADINYDLQVSASAEKPDLDQDHIRSIVSLTHVTEYSLVKRINFDSLIPASYVPTLVSNWFDNIGQPSQSGKYAYQVEVSALDDEHLQSYAKQTGVDFQTLVNPKQLSAIVINTTSYQDSLSRKFIETSVLNAVKGDSIELGNDKFPKVRVAALTNEAPMGVTLSRESISLKLIVSQRVLDALYPKDSDELSLNLYLKSTDPLDTQYKIQKLNSQVYVYNIFQARRNNEQNMLLIDVFTYGFVALITIISIANIFNTISTSLILKTKEIAMLRSVGMTPKGINKMIHSESVFYGIKSLIYGLPLGVMGMYLIYRAFMGRFNYGFSLPWSSLIGVCAAVFLIVSASMAYGSTKVKNVNIIDALKQENV
ncbi:FtsX-like permease family protein [Paenibacillus qinlingensis]|uniref:ABC transport system permease protein n=1 Tax=Paenibacillus qinlingensis TaxID=1837343 RepID=A0ABU1NS88_9BACL|nr:FtsX-like permease family protein [Paenibacillus qinlingensis]MDR6550345.1 putative ABC transport system permease protein [Paenibacillus qinlingensis]